MSEIAEHLRMAEALLFAAAEPLDNKSIAARLPDDVDIPALMTELSQRYEGRGVVLVKVAGKWAFRTAPDLAFLLEKERTVTRRLSKAAVETLAIVAYHQPVTRAEIEEIRGVGISRGTLDMLMEVEWVRLRGRRRSPGRPVTYGTTEAFLEHFGLEGLDDLPGLDELKKSGLLRAEPSTDLFPRSVEGAEPEDTDEDDRADEDEGVEEEALLEPLIAEAELEVAGEDDSVTEAEPAEQPNSADPNPAEKVEPQSFEAVHEGDALVMADAPEDQAAARRALGVQDGLAEPILAGAAKPESV